MKQNCPFAAERLGLARPGLLAGEGNATDPCSGGKDVIPLFALTVSHYSPQTIFTCPLFLSGAAPQHKGKLLRLPAMGNSKYRFFFSIHQLWCLMTIKGAAILGSSTSIHLLNGGVSDHGILTGLFNSGCSKYPKWINVLFNYFFKNFR